MASPIANSRPRSSAKIARFVLALKRGDKAVCEIRKNGFFASGIWENAKNNAGIWEVGFSSGAGKWHFSVGNLGKREKYCGILEFSFFAGTGKTSSAREEKIPLPLLGNLLMAYY